MEQLSSGEEEGKGRRVSHKRRVASPLLANIYLHYAFDLWVQWWRTAQLDYVFCLYGLSFILLALTCRGFCSRGDRRAGWHWLGLFGLLHGLNEWLDMLAISLGDSTAFRWVRAILLRKRCTRQPCAGLSWSDEVALNR